MNKYEGLESIVGKDKIKYNESMKKYTTVRVGGNCDAIVFPESIDEIKGIIKYCKLNKIKYFVIGNGSNLLVNDNGIHALIIRIGHRFSKIILDDDEITVLSGNTMPEVSQFAKKNSLSGFEFACGIPGTIGGGIKMNAGAYNSQISDILTSVTFLNDDLELVTISNKECDFGYRHSVFIDNDSYIILSATFKLIKDSFENIEKRMNENNLARRTKQPLDYPNFGSTFKRPEGYFVGKLITDSNLKGYTIGGAQVSTKHAGFIVNLGDATCSDILKLIKYIQKVVYEKFNVKLIPEVIILEEKN